VTCKVFEEAEIGLLTARYLYGRDLRHGRRNTQSFGGSANFLLSSSHRTKERVSAFTTSSTVYAHGFSPLKFLGLIVVNRAHMLIERQQLITSAPAFP